MHERAILAETRRRVDVLGSALRDGRVHAEVRENRIRAALTVPLAEKGDMLVNATRVMREHGADTANAAYDIWDTTKWLARVVLMPLV